MSVSEGQPLRCAVLWSVVMGAVVVHLADWFTSYRLRGHRCDQQMRRVVPGRYFPRGHAGSMRVNSQVRIVFYTRKGPGTFSCLFLSIRIEYTPKNHIFGGAACLDQWKATLNLIYFKQCFLSSLVRPLRANQGAAKYRAGESASATIFSTSTNCRVRCVHISVFVKRRQCKFGKQLPWS